MHASIITIGDELLNGQTIDTNSAWLAQKMNQIGITIKTRIAVGDVYQDIWNALEHQEKESPIIFITGGLGPTSDDITKTLLCKYFNASLICHNESLELIKQFFQKRNRPILERNTLQAFVPNTCKVLVNHLGTAPGMWFEKNNTIFISLPGVPFEMKGLVEKHILPDFKKRFNNDKIIHRFILTHQIGESFIAEKITHIEQQLPHFIKLAYLPSLGAVKLRLTGKHPNEAFLNQELNKFQNLISQSLHENVISSQHDNILDALIDLLTQNNITIACAESCTGGYIAHLLTQKEGASQFFLGSIVAYNNTIKQQLLNVNQQSLQQHSAVSPIVAQEMLQGIFQQYHPDYAIAITGYVSGNPSQIPVGTIHIAIGSPSSHKNFSLNLAYNLRQKNIETASNQALIFLYQFIQQNLKNKTQI